MLILVINCGSTSTKLAVYDDLTEKCRCTYSVGRSEEMQLKIKEQTEAVNTFLSDNHINSKDLTAVVARGGCFYPVEGGAYLLDADLAHDLYATSENNAGNMSGILAYRIAQNLEIPAYIFDAVCVDEMMPVARLSGVKGVDRYSRTHTLNTRAMAREAASERGADYRNLNIITAHLGGGCSVNIYVKGRIVDLVTSEEGGFSAERCGGMQGDTVMDLIRRYGIEYTENLFHGNGGLKSYFGHTDAVKIAEQIESGDEDARLVFEAMAYQIAKSICSLAATVEGKVDFIVLTGGLMNSELLAEMIRKRVSFLADVIVKPGERELSALAAGAVEVLQGKAEAKKYTPYSERA